MADITVGVKLEGDKGSLKDAGKIIAEGMTSALNRLGLGKMVSVAKSYGGDATAAAEKTGAIGAAAGTAVTGALLATGVGALEFIADVLKDMPIITAIMKMLGLIITILLLPLVPILKPVLMLLALLARALAPIMLSISDAIDKLLHPGGVDGKTGTGGVDMIALAETILNGIGDVVFLIEKTIWDTFYNLGLGIAEAGKKYMDYFFDLGVKLRKWTDDIGTKISVEWSKLTAMIAGIWDTYLKPIWDWLQLKMLTIWDIIKMPFQAIADALSTAVTAIKNLGGKIMTDIRNSAVYKVAASVVNKVTNALGIKDGIVQNGQVITTDPSDYLIATKNPKDLMGGVSDNGPRAAPTFIVNIDKPTIRNDDDIKALIRLINKAQQEQFRRYTSYVK